MVTAYGGTGIPAQVDHTKADQVKALFARVREEQGRLDVLVNDVWGGDELTEFGRTFWEVSLDKERLIFAMAYELRQRPITSVALTPGFLRSEAMLDHFGVTEENWQEGAKQEPNLIASETPFFVGRAVAALAADPQVKQKSGRAFSSWDLAVEYGFTDLDERRPHWGKHFEETYGKPIKKCDETFYDYWLGGPGEIVFPDWP